MLNKTGSTKSLWPFSKAIDINEWELLGNFFPYFKVERLDENVFCEECADTLR